MAKASGSSTEDASSRKKLNSVSLLADCILNTSAAEDIPKFRRLNCVEPRCVVNFVTYLLSG